MAQAPAGILALHLIFEVCQSRRIFLHISRILADLPRTSVVEVVVIIQDAANIATHLSFNLLPPPFFVVCACMRRPGHLRNHQQHERCQLGQLTPSQEYGFITTEISRQVQTRSTPIHTRPSQCPTFTFPTSETGSGRRLRQNGL